MRWAWLFVISWLVAPASASAWADASVRSARATVRLDEGAHAHVAVDVTVRVDGGWLEGFDLDGLDPDLVLDPADPVTLSRVVSADADEAVPSSEPVAPRVAVHEGGRIALTFARRNAPRRGDYVVHVAYDTLLAGRTTEATPDGLVVGWTFPAWRFGLDAVELIVLAPSGSRVLLAEDDEVGTEQTSEGALTRIRLTRAHLARTREWPIAVLIPLGRVDSALRALEVPAPPVALVSPVAIERPWNAAVALLVAGLLVALRVAQGGRRCEAERSVEHPLVPLGSSARALAVLAATAGLIVAERVASTPLSASASLVMVALSASRARPAALPPKLGSFRHATPTLLRAARRQRVLRALGLDAWLDATSLPGIALVLGLAALVRACANGPALGAGALALALVVHAFLVDTRVARSEPALVTLDRLVGFARRVRFELAGPSLALLPVVHLGVGGQAHDARLRVVGAVPPDVLRVDVVPQRRGLVRTQFALLVVVRVGSSIDDALREDPRFREVSRGTERVARVFPLHGARVSEAYSALIAAASQQVLSPDLRAAA